MAQNANPLERAAAAFRKAVVHTEVQSYQVAYVGKWDAVTEEPIFDVPGRARYKYVRRGETGAIPALNEAGVPDIFNLPVKVRLENNTLVIKGIYAQAEGALSGAPGDGYGNYPHPLGSHSDVLATAATDNQLLQWDAADSQWEATTVTTADIGEGANLYFTNERAQDAVGGSLVDGNGIDLTYDDTANTITAALTTLGSNWDIGEDMAILAERLNARDVEGLSLYDDGGNRAIWVVDGGNVVMGSATPGTAGRLSLTGDAHTFIMIEGSFSARMRLAATGSTSGSRNFEFTSRDDSFQISSLVDNWTSYTQQYILVALANGNLGMGVLSPQGKLHMHDGTSGWLHVTKTGVGTTPQTIIPNGSGDVVYVLGARVAYRGSDGTSGTITLNNIRPGNVSAIPIGTDTFHLRVNADGSVDIYNFTGALTAQFNLDLQWM